MSVDATNAADARATVDALWKAWPTAANAFGTAGGGRAALLDEEETKTPAGLERDISEHSATKIAEDARLPVSEWKPQLDKYRMTLLRELAVAQSGKWTSEQIRSHLIRDAYIRAFLERVKSHYPRETNACFALSDRLIAIARETNKQTIEKGMAELARTDARTMPRRIAGGRGRQF